MIINLFESLLKEEMYIGNIYTYFRSCAYCTNVQFSLEGINHKNKEFIINLSFEKKIYMSWDTYQQAIHLMEQNKEECDFVGERTDELINKAENVLGFSFSKIYRDFVKKFGAGNFGSQEVYGVIDDDFENSTVPDAIWFTLTEREDSKLSGALL